MLYLTVILIGIAVLATPLVIAAWREHRTPPELRDDWWPRFESQFRAYAERTAHGVSDPKRATDARRAAGETGP
jgi:hypothetical protein